MTPDHGPSKVHALPLAEAGARATGDDEALVRRLVDAFYAAAQRDEVLGPVFSARVADWDRHLPTMRDFWSTVVFRTARYAGRPFEKHEAIAELTPAHFGRWLTLWRATVREHTPPGMHEAFITPAERMASSMQDRVFDK